MWFILEDVEVVEVEIISSLMVFEEVYVSKLGKIGEILMFLMMVGGGIVGIVFGGGLIFVLGMFFDKFYYWEEIKIVLKEKEVFLLGVLFNVINFDLDMKLEKMFLLIECNLLELEFYEKLWINLFF